MSLEYALYKREILEGEHKFVALVENTETIVLEEIIRRMTKRGLTTTDTEVLSVFNEFIHVLNDLLEEGYAISTPFMKVRPSISGLFADEDDTFDNSRHAIKLNVALGNAIGNDLRKTKPVKKKARKKNPLIEDVYDYQSQSKNEFISRGGTMELNGERLKIDIADPQQGIFMVHGDTLVRVSVYIHNKPSQIVFMAPVDMAQGEVHIIVRNKRRNTNVLCEYQFPASLMVL